MKKDSSYLLGNKFACGNKPNKGSFKKGNIPWNKGLKGSHTSPETEFKKGQNGRNWVPVGTITLRTDKNKNKRRWTKTEEPNVWIPYSQWIWGLMVGNIPDGFILHHIDGDSLNDVTNNLSVVSRSAHMKIHWDKIYNSRYCK